MPFGLGAVLASVGVSQAGADLLDKAGELLFGERTKEIVEDVQTQLRAYAGEAPTNHDLESAIRCAELTATRALLGYYRRRVEGENFGTRTAQPPPFIESAQKWTRGLLKKHSGSDSLVHTATRAGLGCWAANLGASPS